MGIVEILIITVIGGVCLALMLSLFGKPKSKKQKNKPEPTKKVEEKPAQTPTEPDRSFKIAKKSRLSRVSKKALQTNSRTATVEKVFERTPPMPQTSEDVYVEPLNPESEKLLKEFEQMQLGKEKVVSLKELRSRAKETQNLSQENEEYSSAKFITSRSQAEKAGAYGKFHVGDSKFSSFDFGEDDKDNLSAKEQSFMDFIEQRRKEKGESSLRFSSFTDKLSQEPQTKMVEQGDIDYSDMVVAEAILNPKYKQIKTTKPKK